MGFGEGASSFPGPERGPVLVAGQGPGGGDGKSPAEEIGPSYANDYTETFAVGVALGAAASALGTAGSLAGRGASNPKRAATRVAVWRARNALNDALRALNEETQVIVRSQR